MLPGTGEVDVAGQHGMEKPESRDNGPAWPSDTKLGMGDISQRTVLGGTEVPQSGRGPLKMEEVGCHLGSSSARVTE